MAELFEMSAIDTEVVEEVQLEADVDEGTQTEEVETVDPQVEESSKPEAEPEIEPINSVTVDGVGELTFDEIKELKQSGLRQSDYTKKTQEVARLREEAQDAMELLAHLKANPQLVEVLRTAETNPNHGMYDNATPQGEMLNKLVYNQKSMEIDMKIDRLKAKYGNIDEVALYNKAAELKTDDFEFVYKALSYEDNETNKQKYIDEAKAQLKAELEANRDGVRTSVGTTPPTPPKEEKSLSPEERRVADGMGLTEAEYMKWQG